MGDASTQEWVTKLGSVEALTVVALVTAAVLVGQGRRRAAATVAVSLAGAVALARIAKLLLHRERPPAGGGGEPALSVSTPSPDVLAIAACLVAMLAVVLLVAARAMRGRGVLADLALAAIFGMPHAIDVTWKHLVAAADAGHPASFPSAHALDAAATALAVAIAAWPTRWRGPVALAAVVAVVAVGVTRVSLSTHHPTDVLAGWMVGVAWTTMIARVVLHGRDDGSAR